MYNTSEMLFACAFILSVGYFLWRFFQRQRWGVLEFGMTLVGATLPVALISRELQRSSIQPDSSMIVPMLMLLFGGLLITTIGTARAMRWIQALEWQRSLLRVPLLIFGWIIVLAVPVQLVGCLFLFYVVLDRRHDLLPFCIIAAASLLMWIPYFLLERHVRTYWARMAGSIQIWTRNDEL